MNAKELKQWLINVPDDAELVAAPSDETTPPRLLPVQYNVEPVFFYEHNKVVFIFGS